MRRKLIARSAVAMSAILALCGASVLQAQTPDAPTRDAARAEKATADPHAKSHAEKNLEHKMDLPKQGLAVLVPSEGQKVYGIVCFKEMGNALHIIGKVEGLTPGQHGFHIHEYGDLSDRSGTSAGDHFNPHGKEHGALNSEERHAGDFGNIEANKEGVATIDIQVKDLPLHFILGRGLVVHAKADDLKSQPSGDAGDRVAVGVIGIANPKTAEKFKSMKGNQGTAQPTLNSNR